MHPDPKNAILVYSGLAYAYHELGNYKAALVNMNELRRLMPREPMLVNSIAWLRATHPDPAVRDGKAAIRDATRACELTHWKDGRVIDTLAAAYAETGDFDRAIKTEQRALAQSGLTKKDSAELLAHRRLFDARQPVRDTPKS